MTEYVVAATGHRPERLGGYAPQVHEKLFALACEHLLARRPSCVISGMALGWDTAFAEAAYCLNLPFKAYVPFEGYEGRWPRSSQVLYGNLLKLSKEVRYVSPAGYAPWKLHRRNEAMVDDAHCMVALWDGTHQGGTFNCIEYAKRTNVEVVNLWDEWSK